MTRGKRRTIITISVIFYVLCLVVSFLIGAQGGPAGGYINIFSFIIPLIGVMQFEVIVFVLVLKPWTIQIGKFSLKKMLIGVGVIGILFIVIGLVIDAYHLPPGGGPYISSYGNLWIIIGCIYIGMVVGTYVREKVVRQIYA